MTFSAPFCLVEPLKLVSASTAFITQFMLNHHSVIIHHPKFCSSHPYYLLSLVYYKYWPDGYVISTWFIHHLHQFHCSWCPWLLFMYWWLMMVIVVWTRSELDKIWNLLWLHVSGVWPPKYFEICVQTVRTRLEKEWMGMGYTPIHTYTCNIY